MLYFQSLGGAQKIESEFPSERIWKKYAIIYGNPMLSILHRRTQSQEKL